MRPMIVPISSRWSRPAPPRASGARPLHPLSRRRPMPVNNRIAEFHDDMTEWRRDFHAHPEIKFEEHRTAAQVAEKLESWGIEVHRGIAGTGVVGVLHGNGGSGRSIGLRADMDALPMDEEGNRWEEHQSELQSLMRHEY